MAKLSKFQFENNIALLQRTKKDLPRQIANDARNFFLRSFKPGQAGFLDVGVEKWEEVQRRIPGTNAYKYPLTKGFSRHTDPILVRSGRLRRAVSDSIRSYSWQTIKLGIDTPYAAAHNEGTTKIPQRKFMGESATLHNQIRKKLQNALNQVLKAQ